VRAPAAPVASTPPPPSVQRDPYESYFSTVADGEGVPGQTALERIPLDRLRLVGIVQQAAPLALLEDDGGQGHVVRIGTLVGTDGGRVKAIGKDRLVIEETFRDPLQRAIPVEKTLPLAPARG
jgi:Tfp pilus assembly protein PilP